MSAEMVSLKAIAQLRRFDVHLDGNPYGRQRYVAITEDYDCDFDEEGFFSTSLVGYGWTEEEAIQDLLDKIEEEV